MLALYLPRRMTDAGERAGARSPSGPSKAERRAARESVGRYHEDELRKLLGHVRGGFNRYDAGEIDAFELDDLIHHYKRSAQKLWSFCSGSTQQTAGLIASAGRWPVLG